jgi:hemerythrin-like domain-containing protein
MTDPFEMLVEQHRMAEDLLEQLSEADADERQDLFDQLYAALQQHMQIEETVLYPVVREVLGEEESDEAEAEHGLARQGLEQLASLLPEGPGFDAAVAMVQAGIDHHVQEEESEVFPGLRDQVPGERLEELGAQLRAAAGEEGGGASRATGSSRSAGASRSTGSSGSSGSDGDEPTKAELLEQAKEAGISGRSSMSKEELQQALARQR